MNNQEQLTVYKASAGSGKTFRLACEYIKLLIDNPITILKFNSFFDLSKKYKEALIKIVLELFNKLVIREDIFSLLIKKLEVKIKQKKQLKNKKNPAP